jgi:hypothetical protein
MFPIPPPILNIFRRIHTRLHATDINWVLTGSLAFAMQGIPLTPADIDLQTDREGAYRIEALLAEFVATPVSDRREAERVRSHLGDLLIDGVKVQVMGDMQKRQLVRSKSPTRCASAPNPKPYPVHRSLLPRA